MKIAFTNPIISPAVSNSGYINSRNVSPVRSIDNNRINPANIPVSVSFTGNPSKHTNQIASIASEYQGPLNSIYKAGGLGNVAGEAAVAFHDYGKADIRTFVPYYAPDNENGGIKVKTPLLDDAGNRVKWQVPQIDGTAKSVDAYTFKSVPVDYKLKAEEAFVIHDFVSKDKPWSTAYVELKDTGIKGQISTIKKDFSGMEKVPYHMYQLEGTGNDIKGHPTVYVMHTPATAKFPKAYVDLDKGDMPDISYAKTYRAVVDALPKMDNEKFGNYNPASFWCHDRQVFSILPVMAEKSANGDEYFDGLRIHNSFHNPGRGYQGHFRNPFEFIRLVGSEADFKAIKEHPDYKFVKECEKKIAAIPDDSRQKDIRKVLNEKEVERLYAVFDPIIGNFKDEFGEYNACKIPVEGVRKNPYNITAGTVSTNYGKEMKNHNSKEIAKGLTSDFASIPTIDIVNGSTPASLNLDKIGNFGKGNGFEPLMADNFHPLTEEMKDPKNIYKLTEAKEANKKFVIGEVAKATEKGPDALAKLFFNEKQLSDGCSVLGGLSEYKSGDVLFIGWGRPTDQKGFPTSIEAVKQFLMSDAPEEDKLHAKFLFGAGPWKDGEENFEAIKKGIKEIQELEGGKYKGQVAYVNGFFSNRMVACADYALITSVYEPCGITPLEAFSAGTPVISNATGGSPDFISPLPEDFTFDSKMTGMLTKHPFLVNPEVMGLDKDVSREELTLARRKFLGKENADCVKSAMKLYTNCGYHKMMANCLGLSIDWHNNNDFNGGRSAMQRYFNDAWNISDDLKEMPGFERNTDPLKSLKGKMAVATYSRG